MHEPGLNALSERVARLERENRWLRSAGGLAVALVAAVFLMGQSLPVGRTVEAEQILLRDAAGNVRVLIGAVPDASDPSGARWGLALYSPQQAASVYLHDDGAGGGAQLSLLGSHSSTTLGAHAEATVSLQAYKTPRAEWDRYVAQVNADFLAGRIAAVDHAKLTSRGVTTLALSARDGAPTLMLTDEQKVPRAVLGPWQLITPILNDREQRPISSLLLFDQNRNVVFKSP